VNGISARRGGLRLTGLGLVVAVWWLASARADSLYLPPLPDVLTSFRSNWLFERFGSDVVPSLRNMFAGLALAVVAGVALGAALGLSRRLHDAVHPALEFLRSIPPPVFLSFGLLVLGTGPEMKVAVIALGPIWPIMLNTMDGVRETDGARIEMARVFGLSRPAVLRRIVAPSALPRIAAGVRVGLPLALVLMVISELTASTEGIGYFVSQASNSYAMADMWSGIVLLGLLGWLFTACFSVLERRVLAWSLPR